MPFTPFHFGPGLLVKSVVPRAFSLVTFIVVQVVIDIETLYHLLRHEWPVHGVLHSLLGGTAVGLGVAAVSWRVGRAFVGRVGAGDPGDTPVRAAARSDSSLIPALMGGVFGGASHSMLDGMMHSDVSPYWPFSGAFGLLGMLSVPALHLSCVLAGITGAGILWLGLRRQRLAA